MLYGGVDRLIDVPLALLGDTAANLLILDSSTGSMIHNTRWTLEDGCIIKAELTGEADVQSLNSSQACLPHTHCIRRRKITLHCNYSLGFICLLRPVQ